MCSHASMAQIPVNKSGELWAVWEEAEKKLENGQFDDAIILYRAYERNFAFRLKQALELKQLYTQGQKLQKAGRYSEAINTYKEHRNLQGIGSLTVFDQQIEECIRQMESPKSPRIKDTEKRVISSVFAYNGQKKLRELDTLGAEKDYNLAKSYGSSFTGNLKEQYEEGLKITEELREWGRQYKRSKTRQLSLAQERNILESYRKIKGVPVLSSVEIKIREIAAEIEGKNSLLSFAQNCETDLLLNYINQNKSRLAFSESLVSTLNQYKSIQNKISILKSNMENAKTVNSAFFSVDSMARSVKELPDDVKKSLELCIKNEKTKTFEAYANQARKAGDLNAEKEFEAIARGTESNTSSACVLTEDFSNSVLSILEKLKTCQPGEARRIWDRITRQLADCEYKAEILKPYEGLVNSISKMESSEQTFKGYQTDAQRFFQSEKYEEAKAKYQQMAALEVCDQNERNQVVKKALREIRSRQLRSFYRFGITGSIGTNKPSYSVADQKQKMNYGLVTSGGIDFSFIDHHNPIDIVAGLEYINTYYFMLNKGSLATDDYKISGINVSLNFKIHPSNTNPNKIRPYFKIGRDGIIPLSYQYENYASRIKINDKQQLRNVISSIQGAVGLEKQKKHFGYFVEAGVNYGINGIYDKSVLSLTGTGSDQVSANFRRYLIKVGLRFW